MRKSRISFFDAPILPQIAAFSKRNSPLLSMSRLLLFLVFFLCSVYAHAASTDWIKDDAVAVRLISATEGVGDDTSILLGLELQLADGWHTYWRSPGEAGLPPEFDWSRSETPDNNLKSATLLFPAPVRYVAYGLETIGYKDHVLFPITAVLRVKGQALVIDTSLDLLVCSTICVPKHYDFKLKVPTGEAIPSVEAHLLEEARQKLPSDPDVAGILLKSIVTDGKSVAVSVTSRDLLTAPDIFIEDTDHIDFGAPSILIDAQGHDAVFTVKPVDTIPSALTLSSMPLTLTLTNGAHATEIRALTPSPTPAIAPVPPKQVSLMVALLCALIGGLILNLMPCVLPVLSLKIMSVVSHGGATPKRVRQSFLLTAAGILFSFLILAGVTATFKVFGTALGWGVQFQQPLFLMFLIILLTFFACNMCGLFDIPLPRFLVDKLDTTYHPKLAGDFATGAFATLLATPCSAPFLGTAVGFALASSTSQIFIIFLMLGAGMSGPYILVALFPPIVTFLPKPGLWMIYLRWVLALALTMTALWLTWVLAAQITPRHAAVFGLFMVAISILLILRKRGWKNRLIVLGIGEICLVAIILGITGALEPRAAPEMDRRWLAYDPNALEADIAEKKVVFLDVTADWCLTCKANMKFSLSDAAVAQKLFDTDIVAMQADWTNPDPAITDLLHKYGRYGIPFNIVYGPAAPQGIVLPELLTPSLVLKALEAADAPSP